VRKGQRQANRTFCSNDRRALSLPIGPCPRLRRALAGTGHRASISALQFESPGVTSQGDGRLPADVALLHLPCVSYA